MAGKKRGVKAQLLTRKRPKPRPMRLPIPFLRFGDDQVGVRMGSGRVPSEIEIRTQFSVYSGRLSALQLAKGISGDPKRALAKLVELHQTGQVTCQDANPTIESIWQLIEDRRQAPVSVNGTKP